MSSEALLGKVPPRILEEFVFSNLGARNRRIICGPAIGLDNAVVTLDGIKVIVSSDPITGAKENLGRLGVIVSTNDVALTGARPEFLTIVLILPPKTREDDIGRIMAEASKEARKLGVSIIGGHTEYSSRVTNPIFIGTSIGWTKRRRLISSSGAKAGDDLIVVGEAGVEGTSILASDLKEKLLKKGMNPSKIERATRLVSRLSIVKPSLISADYASAMHDPTEGGILGGIYEICEASRKGCIIDLSSIPINQETREICGRLGLDPLKLISSGCLLTTSKSRYSQRLMKELRKAGFKAKVIGKIIADRKRRIGLSRGKEMAIDELPQDELWRALAQLGTAANSTAT